MDPDRNSTTIIWTSQTQPLRGLQRPPSDGPVPATHAKKTARGKAGAVHDEPPLIDTTAKLALRSKRTERLLRRQQKKESQKREVGVKSKIESFLGLPPELLTVVLSFLLPNEVLALRRLNQFTKEFIDDCDNERTIGNLIIQRRYTVLTQCFPLPVPFSVVQPAASQQALLMLAAWQARQKVQRNSYEHIQPINPRLVCTCMSCVLAWNNLNVILDLAHWQSHLDNRQPLPTIPRGAAVGGSQLTYARILQAHLNTITRTIVRNFRWHQQKTTTYSSSQSERLYHLTDDDIARETDEFLERYGPPSYQPIYMRDNYYTEEAFVPNRKWDKDGQVWKYYPKWPMPHQKDLAWLTARFVPQTP
ncbi:hypothetical protein DV738_g3688, partial [Chaetothyriales sp. CBS 135597]